MEPEKVVLCSYCTKLTSEPTATDELEHCPTLAQLRVSSSSCAICAILLECSEHRVKQGLDRFPQLTRSVAEQSPLSFKLLNSGNTESGVCGKFIEAGIAFPNKFTYVWKFQIAARERLAPSLMPPIWTSFPSSHESKMSQTREWLRTCESSHPECKPKWQCQRPRRFVDLGSDDSETFKLVDTADLDLNEIRYTTVSYCWGTATSPKMTKDIASTYYNEIPRSSLPKTFLDAALLTKALGLRFIWIDAFCIIQDDHDDWTTESTKMGDIYHGSSLTISADESASPSGGVFVQELQESSSRTPRSRAFLSLAGANNAKDILIHVIPPRVKTSILSTRGWTLQENTLCVRNVCVKNSELIWSCGSGVFRESGIKYTRPGRENGETLSIGASIGGERNHAWWKLMEDYSRRRFTLPEDRLPAILGLINYYQFVTQDLPVLGLWKSSLHEDLDWMRMGTQDSHLPERLPDQNLPSWSPFACDQIVEFSFWNLREEPNETAEFCVDVVDFEVSWEALPYFSKVRSSSLTIEAPLQELYLSEATEIPGCNPPYFNVDDEVADVAKVALPWRCAVQWDKEGFRPPQKWLCLLLRRETTKGWRLGGETFLVLEAVGAGMYRRVGIGSMGRHRTSDESAEQEWKFDHTVRSRITLV